MIPTPQDLSSAPRSTVGRSRRWRSLVAAALGSIVALSGHAATINSSTPYLNGSNLPWINFGEDFGVRYNATAFENAFAAMQAKGVNSTRIWVHCGGHATPLFNASGDVTGLPGTFISDLQNMLDRAAAHNIKIQLCLWSFDMLNTNHASLITNTTYRSNYITKALNPMLDGIVSKPALAVIEVINEPEWGLAETPATTTQSVTKAQMQAFVSAIANAIHAKTTKNVTVGSASIKWSTANGKDATVGDWWANVGQNHRDVHFYGWMVGNGYNYDPFAAGHTPAYYGWSTPAVIGEFPAVGDSHYASVSAMMEAAWNNGYAGHMPWSYNGVDSQGSFANFSAASQAFANAHLGGGGGATVNYTFESSTQNWGVKFGGGSVATSATRHQGSGTRSLAVTFNNTADTGVGVNAPTPNAAGKTITVWVWVPNQSTLNGMVAYVEYGSGWTWVQGATKSNASLTKNAWNALTVAAPAGQTIQQIGVLFDFVSTGSGTYYIDSVTY